MRRRFAEANTKKRFDPHDLVAGRAYVAAYVPFLHYVEGIYEATQAEAHGHYPDAQASTERHAKEEAPR